MPQEAFANGDSEAPLDPRGVRVAADLALTDGEQRRVGCGSVNEVNLGPVELVMARAIIGIPVFVIVIIVLCIRAYIDGRTDGPPQSKGGGQ